MREWIRSHLTYANVMVTILAFVVLGGMSYAATGGNFILGKSNTASSTSSLSAPVAGKALNLTNTSTGAGATALGLNVAAGHAPFTVNSGAKVANLNADKLDGTDSSGFFPSSQVKRIHWQAQTTPANGVISNEVLTDGPLHLSGTCFAPSGGSGHVRLDVASDAAASANWFFVQEGTASGNGLALPANSGFQVVADKQTGRLEGTLIYDWAGGTISVALHAFHIHTNAGTQSSCEIYGTAVTAT
jgi:hypothetical protein